MSFVEKALLGSKSDGQKQEWLFRRRVGGEVTLAGGFRGAGWQEMRCWVMAEPSLRGYWSGLAEDLGFLLKSGLLPKILVLRSQLPAEEPGRWNHKGSELIGGLIH